MAYTTFPTISGLGIIEESYEIEDPVIETEFENGWTDVRAVRSRPRFINIKNTYIVDQTDKDTIINFLLARRLKVEPFYLAHDKLGTILVRLKAPVLTVTFEILGDPVWYKLDLVFDEQF